jgi:hypothetical protein
VFKFFIEEEEYELTDTFSIRCDFDIALTVEDNKIILTIQGEEVENVRATYFYEIVNVTTLRTWFAGTAHFTDTTSAEVSDATDVTIVLDGDDINVTINEAGGEVSGDVDGGTP